MKLYSGSSLNGRAIKRAIKEKKLFLTFFFNVPTAIKLEEGGGFRP